MINIINSWALVQYHGRTASLGLQNVFLDRGTGLDRIGTLLREALLVVPSVTASLIVCKIQDETNVGP